MQRKSRSLVRAVTGMLLMLRSKDCRVLRASEFCGDVKKRITSCLLCNTARSCVGRRNHWLRKGKTSLMLLLSSKEYKHANPHFPVCENTQNFSFKFNLITRCCVNAINKNQMTLTHLSCCHRYKQWYANLEIYMTNTAVSQNTSIM